MKNHDFDKNINKHNWWLDVPYSKGVFAKDEFDFIQEEGWLPPNKLPYAPKELMDKIVIEADDFVNAQIDDPENIFQGTNHLQWWLPNISELMAGNQDYFAEIMKQITGKSGTFLTSAHLIHVKKGKGKAMLHNDVTAVNLWNQNPVFDIESYFMNLYIALTPTDENTSALFVYPKTHKQINYSDKIWKVSQEEDLVEEEFKRYGNEALFTSASLPQKQSQEAHKGEKDDYGIGMCGVYHWYDKHYDSENLKGKFVRMAPGEYTLFNPNTMHSSEWPNKKDHPRMSLVLVLIRTYLPPWDISYYFMNDKYHLGKVANLFTDQLIYARENLMYTNEELVDRFARHYNKKEDHIRKCLMTKQRFKDNKHINLVSIVGDTNMPALSLVDCYETAACFNEIEPVKFVQYKAQY